MHKSLFFGDETGEIIFKGDLNAKLKITLEKANFRDKDLV